MEKQIDVDLNEISSKIKKIKKYLSKKYIERDSVIDCMFLAIVSKQHLLMVGPPGTGKTALTNELTSFIEGSRIFNWQLNKTTDTSELFGPISISGLEKDRFYRKTDNTLVDAHFSYLDEIMKANSAILNSLLQIMNERTFNNDGNTIHCPLMTIFSSSNEWGFDDDSLTAFLDRFVFKFDINYISNSKNLKKILNNAISNSIKRPDDLTLNEIHSLQSIVKNIKIDEDIVNSLIALILGSRTLNIVVSDRKIIQCLDIMKANAVIENREAVILEDLECLANVLWDGRAKLSDIISLIKEISRPWDTKYSIFAKDFNNIINGYLILSERNEKVCYIAGIIQTIDTLRTNLANLIINCNSTDDRLNDLDLRLVNLSNELIEIMKNPNYNDSTEKLETLKIKGV